jgi:hypothetical protein
MERGWVADQPHQFFRAVADATRTAALRLKLPSARFADLLAPESCDLKI